MQNDIQKVTDEAIQKGYDNAKEEWRKYALECLRQVCLHQQEFTMNDVRGALKHAPIKTHDNRAVGGVVATARKEGWIEPTGKSIQSLVGHKSPLQIWRSLIYKPKDTLF